MGKIKTLLYRQKVVLWTGITIIVLMCLFPPCGIGRRFFGYAFLFSDVYFNTGMGSRAAGGREQGEIELVRLIIQCVIVGLITGALLYLNSEKSEGGGNFEMNLNRGFKRRVVIWAAVVFAVICMEPRVDLVRFIIQCVIVGLITGALLYLNSKKSEEGDNFKINLNRGFKRLVVILAAVIAVICAALCVNAVVKEYVNAKNLLRSEQNTYLTEYGKPPELDSIISKMSSEEIQNAVWTSEEQRQKLIAKLRKDSSANLLHSDWDLQRAKAELQAEAETELKARLEANFIAEMQNAKANLRELEKGFWINLSIIEIVGLCVLVAVFGAAGATFGFLAFSSLVWLGGLGIRKLLCWLVAGFCDNNRLPPEKT